MTIRAHRHDTYAFNVELDPGIYEIVKVADIEEPPVRVYSHPRSGTHFVGATIARCFYPDLDLSLDGGGFGHWANRRTVPGTEFTAIHGGHRFWDGHKGIYVYRDGRDVCLSNWRTKAFLNPNWGDISLSEFLRKPLDWYGTPGFKSDRGITIVEHWLEHVESWGLRPDLGYIEHDGVHYVRFESLLTDPERVLQGIGEYLGVKPKSLEPVSELVGPHPNQGKAAKWKDHFTDEDLDYFFEIVPVHHLALWCEGG